MVLVTGASTGIGKATALYLDQQGYTVYAGVRKPADGDALRSVGSPRLTTVILDVTKGEAIDDCAQMVKEQHGVSGIKALVNNAGINYISPFEYTDETKARQLMEVNFFGLAKMTQALLPLLRTYAAQNGDTARVVNVGSIGSTVGLPWEPFYHASKFAVLGLSESLNFELKGQRIKVAAVLPGGIRTPFFDKTYDEIEAALAGLPAEGRTHYAAGLTQLKEPFRQFANMASDPKRVATVIMRAIAAQRPRFRYLVGLDANILFLLTRVFPPRLLHRVLGPAFGA